jgi:hypothetical protein
MDGNRDDRLSIDQVVTDLNVHTGVGKDREAVPYNVGRPGGQVFWINSHSFCCATRLLIDTNQDNAAVAPVGEREDGADDLRKELLVIAPPPALEFHIRALSSRSQ